MPSAVFLSLLDKIGEFLSHVLIGVEKKEWEEKLKEEVALPFPRPRSMGWALHLLLHDHRQQAICALSCVVPFAVAVSGRAQEGNCKDNQRQKDGKNAAATI